MPSRAIDVIRITSLVSHGVGGLDRASFQPSTPRIDGEELFLLAQQQNLCATALTNWKTRVPSRRLDVMRLTSLFSYDVRRVDEASF